ncbi:hypothetical protein MTBBW1_370001 [Desulfamplus magnetovallimortis]|uniref:Uncharacterized protein n=1 Tax=Desulfamplus magnetovallimortis TaxID=1246637 RepID=A0A1W1HGG4_9BACT|nr:hypothetical protein MTBBW1_370001 [Desulfamplus magnetovallimortis]
MKKRKPGKKPAANWLEALKKMNLDPNKLEFKELKAFRDLELYLNKPVKGTKEFKYLIYCFRYLTSFALMTIYENRFSSLSNCWYELERLFLHDETFDDEVFVQSWIFCDFPVNANKKTVLDYFEEIFVDNEDNLNIFKNFIESMKKSRLGLYQEILSSKKIIKFRELFTGKIVKAENTIPKYEKGEIFLTRLVEIGEKTYLFGDPKCWPKEYKAQLEFMVETKLFYFQGSTIEEKYEQFMKHAGPYWMSCVVSDQNIPILQPDHYLTYFK